MGLHTTNSVFRVSDKGRLKPVSSATGTSLKIDIWLVASLDTILSKANNKGADQSAQMIFSLMIVTISHWNILSYRNNLNYVTEEIRNPSK